MKKYSTHLFSSIFGLGDVGSEQRRLSFAWEIWSFKEGAKIPTALVKESAKALMVPIYKQNHQIRESQTKGHMEIMFPILHYTDLANEATKLEDVTKVT